MKITSEAFEHNGKIPDIFTCKGDDISPPLALDSIPNGTKSLALIMDDPDAPSGTWVHWVVYDIPADTKSIAENTVPGTQGNNSWGRNDYGGPCPPSGTHRYFFKLYALDTLLHQTEGASKEDIERAMEGHILDRGELIGLFSK